MKNGTVYKTHSNPPLLNYDEIKFKFDCNVDGVISKEKATNIVEIVHDLDKLSGEEFFAAIC